MAEVATSTKATEEDEEEDYGALIYQEIQLRKQEAAAALAAEAAIKNSPSPSTRIRTVTALTASKATRKTASAKNGSSKKPMLKRKRQSSLDEEEKGTPKKKFDGRKYRKICSAEGCTNYAQNGGVCLRHGAKFKRCSVEGCTKYIQKRGLCRHGAKRS